MKWFKAWTSDLSAPVLLLKAENETDALKKAKEESPNYDLIEEYKAANKCKYFRREKLQEQRTTPQGMRHVVERTVERCIRSKYNPLCYCKGNKEKCDFYPEVRNK